MISIILAGGAGTRLWPLSRKFWPKFLIKLPGQKYSLLQQTFLRVKRFTSQEKIFIVVNKEHKFLVKENIQDLKINFPLENIISEPDIKNTLPAITLCCRILKEKFSLDEVVGVFPSDHFIKNTEKFVNFIREAEKAAKKGPIVLFGIKPTRIEPGYGHIVLGGKWKVENVKCEVYEVEKFIEKPEFEVAKKLTKLNNVYWNSGIFVFSLKVFFEELKTYQPEIFNAFENENFYENLKKIYSGLPSIPIDKGLIEKSKNVLVIPINISWDDLGSWNSLERIYRKDQNGNIIFADNIDIGSKNIIVFGNKRIITTAGLQNLIVVDTEDALLVINKNYDQEVKNIVEMASENEVVKYHKTTQRPWGFYTVLKEEKNYKVKLINVLPKKRLSLQKHKKRAEQWFVVSGVAKITCGKKVVYLKKGETLRIEKNTPHRLENPSKTQILEIVEVSYGSYLGEDDIIRLEDDFGREKTIAKRW